VTGQAWIGLGGFGALLGLILLDIPIGIAMGVVGLVGLTLLIGPDGAFATLKVVGHGDLMSYGLSVVPLFVLMGVFAAHAGLSAQLFRAANAFLGHRRGGLTVATIAAAAGFSAICGSSLATAATMGKVALPEMRRYGYEPGFSAGTVAAGGTLGILIPPSIMMIVYSIITETPLLGLFAGALVPGLMAVGFYVAAILLVTARRPDIAPPSVRLGWGARLRGLRDAGAVIAIFILVIGGIYGGLFTPTEAASVGAFLTGAVFLATQGLDLAAMREVLLETAGTTAMIFLIVIGAGLFSFFLSFSGLPRVFAGAVTGLGLPPIAIMMAIVALYLVLGCFMDSLGMMILTVPVLFPLVQELAPDLGMSRGEAAIWFGIVVVIAIEIGLMTPPLGLNVFIIQGVAPDIPVTAIFRGVVPFWLADVARLVVLILIPALVLWFPRWLQ
jgi:tripartite ATP-independent transporter DctM subunit